MVRRRKPPSQSWKTFRLNHADAIAAIPAGRNAAQLIANDLDGSARQE
jgi:hypothetical protein